MSILPKLKHRKQHYLEYYILLVVYKIVQLVPLFVTVYFALYLAKFISLFIKFRNKVVMENLEIAFPDKSIKEKEFIRDRMFESLIITSLESIKYPYMSKKKRLEHIIPVGNSMKVMEDIYKRGVGCIGVGGHYGFFEGAGHFSTAHDYPIAFVVANQRNKLVEKLIDKPRFKSGLRVIHRKKVRELFTAIKEGSFIAMLTDQNAGKHGIFINFFDKEASTHSNPAVLCLKKKLPMMFVCISRDKQNIVKHNITIEEINYSDIEKIEDISMDEKVKILTQRYTTRLEVEIKKDPTQYWWIHKRYKTKRKTSNK